MDFDYLLQLELFLPAYGALRGEKKKKSEEFLSKFNPFFSQKGRSEAAGWQIHIYLATFDHVTHFIFTVNVT